MNNRRSVRNWKCEKNEITKGCWKADETSKFLRITKKLHILWKSLITFTKLSASWNMAS